MAITTETESAKSFRLSLAEPAVFVPGQHYIVRLTAPDGYTASRSYSVASAPDGSSEFELTVERLEDGEVSGFLHDVLQVGDELEVRGPIGGYFVWDGAVPAVLVGGGSGVVPLMSMLRAARKQEAVDRVRLLLSARAPDDVYYRTEMAGPESTIIYTRRSADGDARPPGRMTRGDLEQALAGAPPVADSRAYVCGSSGFADAATDILQAVGFPTERIRVERFGPTG